MEYCLIEHWEPQYKLPKKIKAVGISPNACYELECSGIDYLLLNDFHDVAKIKKIDFENYFYDQLSWFKEFDQLIQEIYSDAKKLDLKLANLYYYNIKYMVDHLISDSKVLKSFFDKAKPTKIWYLEGLNTKNKFDRWHWFTYGKNSYFEIIESLCYKNNIECEKFNFFDNDSKAISSKKESHIKSLIFNQENIKSLIKKYFPRIIYFIKDLNSSIDFFLNTKLSNNIISKDKKKIFVVKIFKSSFEFIKDSSENGYSIEYLKNYTKAASPIFFKRKKIPFIKKNNIVLKNNININKTINNFSDSDLMEWINLKCGIDVSKILLPRFELLFKDTFPKTIGLIIGFYEYFSRNNINYVFTNSLATTYDFAAVAAARLNAKTKSVGFFHGIDVVGLKERYFMEYNHFDLYFTTTSNESKYIEKLKKKLNFTHPELGTIPYYKNYFIKKSKNKSKQTQTVLFLPIVRKKRNSAAHTKKHITTMDAIRWHNALLEYFSKRSDLNFIWKDNTFNRNFDNTIIKKLSNNNYKNISYDNRKLYDVLPLVSKVICDIPSTGFFECAISGYPLITFKNKDFSKNNLQKNADIFLGKSLKEVESIDEKLKAINDFLNDPPEEYIVNLPKDDSSVIKVLNNNII